jgi:hypothetical protein
MSYPENPSNSETSGGDVRDRPVTADTTTSATPVSSAAPAGGATAVPAGTRADDDVVLDDRRDVDDQRDVDDRRDVVDRQKEAFGGMKFGSCFFGWLTASGTAVLLAAILTGVGAALGLSRDVETAGAAEAAAQSVGWIGGIVLLAVIFVSYLAGGYVAGRMARFNGLKQGLGVWLWAVLIAILAAGAGMLAGARFDVLARVNSFPRLPLNEGTLTTGGILVAIGVVVASLIGALLGGLAGMRYHRRVDRAGLGR